MEWLGDELPLASLPEAIVELRVLFEKAVGDYLCTYSKTEVLLSFTEFYRPLQVSLSCTDSFNDTHQLIIRKCSLQNCSKFISRCSMMLRSPSSGSLTK